MENRTPRPFIHDWLISRVREDCVVDLAERAPDGQAELALRDFSGDPPITPGENSLDIDCRKPSCNGCVRLLLETGGIEPINCETRNTTEQTS